MLFNLIILALVDCASALGYYPNTTNQRRDALGAYILRGLGDETTISGTGAGRTQHATNGPTASAITSAPRASNTSLSFASSTSVKTFHENVFKESIDWPRPSEVPRATKCWSDIAAWSSSSISWFNAHIAGRSWPVTSSVTTDIEPESSVITIYPTDASTYKLCDGSARVDARPTTTTSHWNKTWWTTTHSWLATPTFSPQPCTPLPEDCHIWYNQSSIPEVNEDSLLNLCGNPAHGVDQPCVFGIDGAVELIYFPVQVSNTTAGLCSGNVSTITASPTGEGPNVMTALGRTFTSGAVYMSIKALSAYVDGFNYRVGPSFSDLILTLSSSEVSTQCSGDRIATALDYADLNWPVPASAYNCQHRCGRLLIENDDPSSPECSTIWSDVNPLLAIPTMIKDLSPLWATCAFDVPSLASYWFDPPIALQEQEVMATPSMPVVLTTTPAAPSSKPHDPTPTNTDVAEPTASPSRTPPASSLAEEPTIAFSPIVPSSTSPEATMSEPTPTSDVAEGTTIAFSPIVSSPSENAATTSAQSAEGHSPAVEAEPSAPQTHPGDSPQSSPSTLDDPKVPQTTGEPAQQTAPSNTGFENIPPAVSVFTDALSSLHTTLASTAATQDLTEIPFVTEAPIESINTFSYDPTEFSESSTIQTGPIVDFGGSLETIAQTSDDYVPGSRTLEGGESTTISAGSISAPSSGSAINSQTLQTPAVEGPWKTLLGADDFTIEVSGLPGSSQDVVIESQTIAHGGPAVTISDHMLTHASDGIAIISGSTAIALTKIPLPTPSTLAAGGLTMTVSPISDAVDIGGTTVSAGGPAATISGQVISQGSSGLVLHGSQPVAFTEAPSVLVAGSITITASTPTGTVTGFVIDGTTLSPEGPGITTDGRVMTYGSSGLVLVDAGSTDKTASSSKDSDTTEDSYTTETTSTIATQTLPSVVTAATSSSSRLESSPSPATSPTSSGSMIPPSSGLILFLLSCWTFYAISIT